MEISKDTAAIITGGGSGLGAATAEALASKGVKVALFDRNFAAADAIAKKLGGLAFECDVTSDTSVAAAIQQAAAKHGKARICINCAGIAPGKRIINRDGTAMPLQDFQLAININLIGTFNVMRLAAADMCSLESVNADNERGVIINTASIAAFEGQIGQTAYSASKGAVAAMTLPAARELARFGVRVVTIAPGVFGTPMVAGMTNEVQTSLEQSVPFPKRLGRPDEYAKLALQIIDNTMFNGTVVRLDGAIRMQEK